MTIAKISGGCLESICVVSHQSDSSVAVGTQQATNSSCDVVMIDVEVRPGALRLHLTDRTQAALSREHLVVLLNCDAVLTSETDPSVEVTSLLSTLRVVSQVLPLPLARIFQVARRAVRLSVSVRALTEGRTWKYVLASRAELVGRISNLTGPKCSADLLIVLGRPSLLDSHI